MTKAVASGQNALALLPHGVNAITQMDCWWIDWESREADGPSEVRAFGIFPQMTLLEELDRAYPTAKFILSTRSPESWLRSVERYGPLREILAKADLPGLPAGAGASDERLLQWFGEHAERVRDHFASRSDGRFTEFALEDGNEAIQRKLEEFLGMPLQWGHHNETTWA